MEVRCEHDNSKKDPEIPGLLECNDCGIIYFGEDIIYWQQPWHLPKNIWKNTIFAGLIMTGIVVGMFILKEAILGIGS